MRILKYIFEFYINASIHVALSVYALTWISLLEFGISYNENVLYFNFFSTITAYNFVKYFGLSRFHYRSLTNWLKVIQVFSFICFIAFSFYAFSLKIITWCFILVIAVITFFYAIPFLPKKKFLKRSHNLREIRGLKIYVIALVWTVVTVFIPIVENDIYINTDITITSVQRFIYVLVLMIPFEIRDLKFDSLKLSTIPQKIGVKKTKVVGLFLLLTFFFLEFFKDNTSNVRVFILAIVTLITWLFVVFCKKNQGKYYCSFWVEGLPVLWLILLLLYNLG